MLYDNSSIKNPDFVRTATNRNDISKVVMRFMDGNGPSYISSPSIYAPLLTSFLRRDRIDVIKGKGNSVFRVNQYTMSRTLEKKKYKLERIVKWHAYDYSQIYDCAQWNLDCPFYRGFNSFFDGVTIDFSRHAIKNDQVPEMASLSIRTQENPENKPSWEAC